MDEQLYQQFYDIENIHWWFAARRKILISYLLHRADTSRRLKLLDVGCGTGALLAEAAHYFDTYGTDASPRAIEFCRKRGLSNLFVGDLDALPGPEHFDIITLLDVIEHIDDDRGTLRQAANRLNKDGAILVTVPAYAWLWSAHDVVNHHKRRYTQAMLARTITGAGFHIVHLSYFNTLLFPLAVFRRTYARVTGQQEAGDFRIPSGPVNAALEGIFGMEQYALPYVSLPFGLSILCWATRERI